MRVRLYDTALVRHLKRAAKERARRAGRKSGRGKWWKGGGGSPTAFWWIWLLANAVRVMAQPGNAPQLKGYVLSAMSLALAGVALSQARKLVGKLTTDGERVVLLFYPISNKDFFVWAALRFVARTVWIPVLAFATYFLTNDAAGTQGWVIQIAAALGEWLIVLCAVFALARYVDKYPRWLPLVLYIAAGALLFSPARLAEILQPLALALPTGWLHVFMTGGRAQRWEAHVILVGLPLVGLLFATLYNRLQVVYCKDETTVPRQEGQAADFVGRASGTELSPEEAELQEELESAEEAPAFPIQATWQKQRLANWGAQAAEYIWRRDWMRLWDWQQLPPIERAAGWCLNQREKGEAQFLLGPKPPAWSEKWKIAVIATAVAFAVMLSGLEKLYFLAVLASAVAVALGLPLLGGNWPVTNQGSISGKLSPIFGCYPLCYWSAGWTMFKLNAVRTAAWVPLGLLLGVLNAKSTQASPAQGCWVVARCILLFLMVMPILLAGKFSKVTNDTLNLRLRLVPFVGAFVCVVFLMITLGAVALLVAPGPWAFPFIVATGLVAWGTWAAYGCYYDRAQVDLLRERS